MMRNLLSDFQPGPLDRYRNAASFNWKKMRIFLDSEELITFTDNFINIFRQNSILHPTITAKSLDEERRISRTRMIILKKINVLNTQDALLDPRLPAVILRNLFHWDPSTTVKYSISEKMCSGVLTTLGTERHYGYLEESENEDVVGCFCLTEISHGSDTKHMRTAATYDPVNQQFILNSSDFEAAKCWAGNLGKFATYAIVYAQLYTPDGKCHGLHSFVVDIRDKTTLMPYPGIIVGDMNAKAGLNGIDNGFIMFKNYCIPRENLLNRTGDVTPDGRYVCPLKDPSKRFGISLGALSTGRVNIIKIGTTYLEKAITIAIRYAAIRKQFGPNDKEELPILEYQLHQWRLLPYLAACYVIRNFAFFFCTENVKFQIDAALGKNKDKLADLGIEIHAISSAGKSLSSWVVRDAIQECREACGGHGYLKVSEIPDLRNNHDANCTYEGESNVLCQQASNWLLKFWPSVLKGEKIPPTVLKSIDFLNDAEKILKTKFVANTIHEVMNPKNIMDAYKWMVCFLLKQSYEKLQGYIEQGLDQFTAKNNTQIFYLRTLSIVYIQHYFMQKMCDLTDTAKDEAIKTVLLRLLSLYGLWSLEKHVAVLYQGGFASGPKPAYLITEGILELCEKIKPDAVSLVDAIAPHDFFMTSPLGKSDGEVYKHLEQAFLNNTDTFARPEWWQEIINLKQNVPNSKL